MGVKCPFHIDWKSTIMFMSSLGGSSNLGLSWPFHTICATFTLRLHPTLLWVVWFVSGHAVHCYTLRNFSQFFQFIFDWCVVQFYNLLILSPPQGRLAWKQDRSSWEIRSQSYTWSVCAGNMCTSCKRLPWCLFSSLALVFLHKLAFKH